MPAKAGGTAKAAARSQSADAKHERETWIVDMLTGVQAVEGCDQSWIGSVHHEFDKFFPESLSTKGDAMGALVR